MHNAARLSPESGGEMVKIMFRKGLAFGQKNPLFLLGALGTCLLLGIFIDWLVLNLVSGCCEGGICIPDLYPECRNPQYDQIYGEGYYARTRKAD